MLGIMGVITVDKLVRYLYYLFKVSIIRSSGTQTRPSIRLLTHNHLRKQNTETYKNIITLFQVLEYKSIINILVHFYTVFLLSTYLKS